MYSKGYTTWSVWVCLPDDSLALQAMRWPMSETNSFRATCTIKNKKVIFLKWLCSRDVSSKISNEANKHYQDCLNTTGFSPFGAPWWDEIIRKMCIQFSVALYTTPNAASRKAYLLAIVMLTYFLAINGIFRAHDKVVLILQIGIQLT